MLQVEISDEYVNPLTPANVPAPEPSLLAKADDAPCKSLNPPVTIGSEAVDLTAITSELFPLCPLTFNVASEGAIDISDVSKKKKALLQKCVSPPPFPERLSTITE